MSQATEAALAIRIRVSGQQRIRDEMSSSRKTKIILREGLSTKQIMDSVKSNVSKMLRETAYDHICVSVTPKAVSQDVADRLRQDKADKSEASYFKDKMPPRMISLIAERKCIWKTFQEALIFEQGTLLTVTENKSRIGLEKFVTTGGFVIQAHVVPLSNACRASKQPLKGNNDRTDIPRQNRSREETNRVSKKSTYRVAFARR